MEYDNAQFLAGLAAGLSMRGRPFLTAGFVPAVDRIIAIQIARLPDKVQYQPGEPLDLTGLRVSAQTAKGNICDITDQIITSPTNGTPIAGPSVTIDIEFADGGETFRTSLTVSADNADITDGDDWWTLYDNGTLWIYCDGVMPNYWTGSPPWSAYKSTITNLFIDKSVTSLGWFAFFECPNLITVSIGQNVTSVGEYSLAQNTQLKSVKIPDKCTYIGSGAFRNCTRMTSITIPVSVTVIAASAFLGCTSLTDVYYIGTSAQWNAIAIGSNNTPLTSATIHYNSTGPS